MTANADGNPAGKRLVIFGCGYVGAEVARQAVARGLAVTALTRNEAKAAALRAAGIRTVIADLAGDDWHGRIEGGAEFVLSCVSSGGGGVDSYRHSYVRGNASILAWARARGSVGTLVYTGSTSVYPQGVGAVVDETAATEGEGERTRALIEAEELVRASTTEDAGRAAATRRWFVLRLAGIYGPGRSHLIEQVRAGAVSGTGEPRLNLAHRDDIVSAIWAVLGAPASLANEIFNISDDHPTPKRDVVRWILERTGWPAPRFTGVPFGGRQGLTPDRTISHAKITRVLGWRPRYPSFREGYEKFLSH
jgi:nucleoside-diphosphate-sugar epimerase